MSKEAQREKEKKEQEKVWAEIFNLMDKDHDGRITNDELGYIIRALDMDPTQKELEEAVKELDKDRNGVIEYSDFRSYMRRTHKLSYEERKQEIITAFRIVDKNHDNFIDAQELVSLLTSMGEPLNQREAEAMIRVADVNQDGKIDYNEFAKFITSPYSK